MVVAIKPDAHRNCVLYFALADEAISRSLLSHRFNTRIRAPPFPTSLSLLFFLSFFLSFSFHALLILLFDVRSFQFPL